MTCKRKTYRSALERFNQALTKDEKRLLSGLNTPYKIQLFLDELTYGIRVVYRSPLRALRERTCQCFDGAVLGAALLHRIGYPALILNMLPNNRDDDHVLALFQKDGHWGVVSKSNFVGLRFREPVYLNLRELMMSYFEHYYNIHRERTLRGYTRHLDLKIFDCHEWMTRDKTMYLISDKLDAIRRYRILTPKMVRRLTLVDKLSAKAGLYGSTMAGVSKFPKKKH